MILQLLEAEEPKFPLSFLLYLWLVFSLGLPECLIKVDETSFPDVSSVKSASSALPYKIFPKYQHFLFTNIIKHHSCQYSSFTFHIYIVNLAKPMKQFRHGKFCLDCVFWVILPFLN